MGYYIQLIYCSIRYNLYELLQLLLSRLAHLDVGEVRHTSRTCSEEMEGCILREDKSTKCCNTTGGLLPHSAADVVLR